jgi:hypothetical protein
VTTAGWLKALQVTAESSGIVSHAGVALPRALADSIGLTRGLSRAPARIGAGRDEWLSRLAFAGPADDQAGLADALGQAGDVTAVPALPPDRRSGRVPHRLVPPTRSGRVPPRCRSAGSGDEPAPGAHGFLDEAGIDAGEPELAAAEQPQRAVAGNVTPGEKRWRSARSARTYGPLKSKPSGSRRTVTGTSQRADGASPGTGSAAGQGRPGTASVGRLVLLVHSAT